MARKSKPKLPDAAPVKILATLDSSALVIRDPDVSPEIFIQTPDPTPADRMARYRKNPHCPECGSHPVICISRRRDKAFFRCRSCGHTFSFTTFKGLQ